MEILNNLVLGMNKEEARFFKLLSNRTSKEGRKDQQLFDYIRKAGEKYDEQKIFRKPYIKGYLRF